MQRLRALTLRQQTEDTMERKKTKVKKVSITNKEISDVNMSVKNVISYLGDDDDVIVWSSELSEHLEYFNKHIESARRGICVMSAYKIGQFFQTLDEVFEFLETDIDTVLPAYESDNKCHDDGNHVVCSMPDINGDIVKTMLLLARLIIASLKANASYILLEIEV